MSTVVETLAEYQTYILYHRHLKTATIRKIDLSLKYFTELYGITETKDLKASDMYIFYEWLKRRRCKKTKHGIDKPFDDVYLQKIMTHVKAFVKRLSDTAQLHTLVPADVPRGKVSAKIPKYLTKDELALIMQRLEKNVAEAILTDNKHTLYSAYLWRAVVRMLYSSGLRNSELRSLTDDDITIPQLCGVVL